MQNPLLLSSLSHQDAHRCPRSEPQRFAESLHSLNPSRRGPALPPHCHASRGPPATLLGVGGRRQLLPSWFPCIPPLPTSKPIFHPTRGVTFPKPPSWFPFLVLCSRISYMTARLVSLEARNSRAGRLLFPRHFQNQGLNHTSYTLFKGSLT